MEAQYTEIGNILLTRDDGILVFVPDDMTNRDRRLLADWQAAGNVIKPYTPPVVSPFLPLDPAPFWLAALDLLNTTQEDILAGVPEGPEREAARINMRDRKTYVRHDPMVDDLATRQSISSEQMDSLWLYVQENYK